jgi:Fe-S cluster biogenesis protein NfuA/nitrite reductase/ring-hydroxylating ferredoxin subunit
VDRVQELTERLEAVAGPEARSLAHELVGAVMEMYEGGLVRVMEVLQDADEDIRERLVGDGEFASLLLIHGLYPVDLETRVLQALESVRPYMESHGGDVELVAITDDDVVQLRLAGHCKTCAASASTLELAIKQALDEYAPDLAGMDVSGFEAPTHDAPVGAVLPVIQSGNGNGNGSGGVPLPMATAPTGPSWHDIQTAPQPGQIATSVVEGFPLVVGNVDGTLLAYKDACAACGSTLASGTLSGPVLTCGSCAAAFDLSRAGRSLDGGAQMGPVPLLDDASTGPRVALAI